MHHSIRKLGSTSSSSTRLAPTTFNALEGSHHHKTSVPSFPLPFNRQGVPQVLHRGPEAPNGGCRHNRRDRLPRILLLLNFSAGSPLRIEPMQCMHAGHLAPLGCRCTAACNGCHSSIIENHRSDFICHLCRHRSYLCQPCYQTLPMHCKKTTGCNT